MTEYIDRQETILSFCMDCVDDTDCDECSTRIRLMAVPAANVIKVIHCKDCVNSYPQNKYDGDKSVWCAVWEVPIIPLCSCGYAKHRIEG